MEQLHKIFKLCGSPSEEYWKKSKLPHATIFKPQQSYKRCIAETFKDFPPSSLPLIETLLAIDPAERQTATAALRSEVSLYMLLAYFEMSSLFVNVSLTLVLVKLFYSVITNSKQLQNFEVTIIWVVKCFVIIRYWSECIHEFLCNCHITYELKISYSS